METAQVQGTKVEADVQNAEWLAERKVGDYFEIEGLFQGVTKEPVVYTLENFKDGKEKKYTFVARYFGAKLGEYLITIKKSGDVKIESVELKA